MTRDHSPVGEREDAGEISELEAMHHPRRNEVYRDVGSEPHQPDDPDFIEVKEVPFEPDAALLLCSDGLTDLVDSASIQRVVAQWAGHPQQVVDALIEAANAAGGKDNVTVVYVEGEQFAVANVAPARPDQEITRRLGPPAGPSEPRTGHRAAREDRAEGRARGERLVRSVLVVLLTLVILLVVFQTIPEVPSVATPPTTNADAPAARVTVLPTQSLAQALQNARAWNDDRGRAGRVSGDAEPQELRPAGEPGAPWRDPPAARFGA